MTGFYSFIYGAARHRDVRRTPCSPAPTTGCSCGGSSTCSPAADSRAAASRSRIYPKAQQVATADAEARPARGAVVAIDPSTGRDPRAGHQPVVRPQRRCPRTTPRRSAPPGTKLNADPNQPLLNRTIAQHLPAGLDVQAGHRRGGAVERALHRRRARCPARRRSTCRRPVGNLPNYDNRPCSPGSDTTTLATALARSCNTTFARARPRARRRRAARAGREVRLQPRRHPRADAAPRPASIPEDLDAPQTALSAIGQFDVRATPLQMAMVAAGVANRGIVMKPYLVDEVLAPDLLARWTRPSPQELSEAVTPQVAAQLPRHDGRGRRVTDRHRQERPDPRRQVAGKTGTAQQAADKPPHAWFVSFAPAATPAGRGRRGHRGRRRAARGQRQPAGRTDRPRRDEGGAGNCELVLMIGRLLGGCRRLAARPAGTVSDRHAGTVNGQTEGHRSVTDDAGLARRPLRAGRTSSAAAAWPRSTSVATSGSAVPSRSRCCGPTWPATRRSRPGSAARRSPPRR